MPNMNLKSTPPAKPAAGVKPGGPDSGQPNQKKKLLGLPMPIALGVAGLLGVGLVVGILFLTGVLGEKPKPKFERPKPPVEASVNNTDTVSLTSVTPQKTVTKVEEPKKVIVDKNKKLNSSSKNNLIANQGSGAYSIQVESWASELKAKSRAQLYQSAGFQSFVDKGGRKNHFRVFVGRFTSRKDAQKAANKISHMLESGYSISKLN